MKISREIKTGIIAVLIIVLFIWGYNFLKDRKILDRNRTYYAMYENVQGLVPTSPVLINGLKVGSISRITFHPTKPGMLVVHMELSNDIEFSKQTVAEIFSPDFISGKSLRLKLVPGSDLAQSGDTLVGAISTDIMGMINEQIAPLQSKVESFVVNSDSVMTNVNRVLDARNQENIARSLENLNQTLQQIKSISMKADKMLGSNAPRFDSIMVNANHAMSGLSQMSDSLQKANISATVAKLEKSINQFNTMLDSINQGKGSLGKLMHDEALYNNMEAATKEMEALLKDMKENPKRYVHFSVFGKKETPYKDPE
ncbi:MAG: MlaD family protein [Flavobacteriaceae bacterium]|nr:MlaD family protein [Flavobacteriaceae bacterium]